MPIESHSNDRAYSIYLLDSGKDLQTILGVLRKRRLKIRVFSSAETALRRAMASAPSMFILETDLVKGDGLELCRQIRSTPGISLVPIIFVSRRVEEADRVVGLEAGADDYITKPFGEREMLARVNASLRRCYELRNPVVLRFDDIEINSEAMTVTVQGVPGALTPSQFRLLEYLARNPGRTFSRDHLLEVTRARTKSVKFRLVDVTVKAIRMVIEPDQANPKYLRTVSGFGYCFHLPDSATRVPAA
jgi:two-component system phosphate regulon response regulator PhoB